MSQQQQQQGSSSSSSKPRMAKLLPLQQAVHLPALGARYELQSVRGKGSSGEVWEARHRRTGHRVAIKILSHARPQAEGGVPRAKAEREIRVMRLLRPHPHVVRFYEAVFAGDHTYIVMELAEAGQLYDHVAIQGRLAEAEARRIFQQLVSGVAHCHGNLIVHRDLKMENVLLDAEGNVRIVDFGFSKLLRHGEQLLRRSRGSPEYAAPELYLYDSAAGGRGYMGPPVDVWSCGVILYGMLCGALPFDGANMSELRRNILRGEYQMPAWVSDDARDLVASMLIVRPEKRASMGEVMAHIWLQLLIPPDLSRMATATSLDAATVEQLVTRHGFDRSSLLDSLHRGVDDEATVAYHLVLSSKQQLEEDSLDAAAAAAETDTEQQQHGRQWALGGLDDVLLHECPRQTMRRIARALQELGILFYSSSSSSSNNNSSSLQQQQPQPQRRSPSHHGMVCAHLSAAVFFEIQLYKQRAGAAAGDGGNTSYVVDLRRISGPQLRYLGICSQLASSIRSTATNQPTHSSSSASI